DSIIVCSCGGQLIQVLSGQTCNDVCCTSCGKPKPSPATDCISLCSPITVSSCGTGEDVIRQCIADVFVADPDTGATLADVVSDAHTQLRTLQDRAIDAVL